MSERDLKRIEVLSEVLSGRRTVAAGAAVLAISERQAYRLLARDEAGDSAELIHKARGQTPNQSVNSGIRQYAGELVKTGYADFGPMHRQQINCIQGKPFLCGLSPIHDCRRLWGCRY